MLTAQEAREIAGPDAKDYLEIIDGRIRAAAEMKEREVIIRDQPYANWLYGTPSKVAKEVIKKLKEYGYDVDLYYQESQFVDMGLWIKW